uniref:RUN domain-containing protein n=1 Tax=Gasterosteus aculeatus aculeatus TaxID=481459 RepID=A0AAQ4P3G8_GASAC
MAPRDPLVGTLRVCVLNLQSDGRIVSDTHPHLASCCELLELVLRKGLQQPVLSLAHRDYWHCFEQLTRQDAGGRLSALSLVVEQTRVCRKLLSAQGRGRYLLRLALRRKALPQFITHLLHTPRVLEWYSAETSILRNKGFVEPFMSLRFREHSARRTRDITH